MAKKIQNIFEVNDNGTTYYKDFSDVIAHLKLAHKRVGGGGMSIRISQVPEDKPQWDKLDWGAQGYYSNRIENWREAGRKLPPHWEEWQEIDYHERRDNYDNIFTRYLESLGEEPLYEKAA